MWSGLYILEVVKYITEKDGPNGWTTKGTHYEHLGYMNKTFKTKREACEYYDVHNTHMRPLNAVGNYVSDWDPNTRRMYIVRKDYTLYASIPPFA